VVVCAGCRKRRDNLSGTRGKRERERERVGLAGSLRVANGVLEGDVCMWRMKERDFRRVCVCVRCRAVLTCFAAEIDRCLWWMVACVGLVLVDRPHAFAGKYVTFFNTQVL